MSFFFLDEWSIKKITVLFLTRNEDHQKIKKIFVLWRMYILKKWNVVSDYIYHGTSKDSGQKNFCSTNSTDFQIDWILTVFDVHLHQQKTVATKQIFKNNFFLQKLDLVLMNRMMIVMWSVCSRDAFETFEMLGKRKCEQNGNVSRNDNYIQYNCFCLYRIYA